MSGQSHVSLKVRISKLERAFKVFQEKHNNKVMLDLKTFKAIENRLNDIDKGISQ